ncbi:rhamnogalacturonan lyase [Paludisphaera rhizosphaerae]|uniref:rhamnogalacturonan lyase n=1 Tax=Paludisphaera rhizosphaerae TaxID=2711216 RepID=UPI0013ECFB57|nr:rhamnogalacturonan lyase [Paludisphaera rhizosphaerae]
MRTAWFASLFLLVYASLHAETPRLPEKLGRGVIAVPAQGGMLVTWRLLGDDPEGAAFHVERSRDGGPAERLTREAVAGATCFLDATADVSKPLAYTVRPIGAGAVGSYTVRAEDVGKPYRSIPLQTLPGNTPNDAAVGDLDGDGEYEIVLKQEMRPRDNSQRGATGTTKLEAYTLAGSFLWRIDLGPNVREGAHYTPFLVYDFDGDGCAEVACRTADGTVDGRGMTIGDAKADHRNADGYVLEGPEFLTVFEGTTGRELATVDYLPERGRVASWGDRYGNRVDRFLAAVAYLDGERPSLVFCRGYYTRTVLAAWDWRDGKLSSRWVFDSDAGPDSNRAYRGQGNHNLVVADVDGDGRDEITYGACAIDDDGRGLYSTGLGHGDALHVSDLDPERPGMEVFDIHEHVSHDHGAEFRDARTGALIWSKKSPDVGRGVAFDIDPRHPGAECWAAGAGLSGLWNARGELISAKRPRSCNFGIWWDGDPLRELLDGVRVSKWDWNREAEDVLLVAEGCASNNGTKSTPALSADILGDWREEVLLRSLDGRELRLYSTPIPTAIRLPTLMHDRQYRLAVACQNVGYNQPPHPSFFLAGRVSGR